MWWIFALVLLVIAATVGAVLYLSRKPKYIPPEFTQKPF
jgi:hypothetical protein